MLIYLKKKKLNFEVREYLKNPLTKEEIKDIVKNLEEDLSEIVRDKKFKKLKKKIDQINKLIFDQSNVMQRPIVLLKKFYICRPPEKVFEILDRNKFLLVEGVGFEPT